MRTVINHTRAKNLAILDSWGKVPEYSWRQWRLRGWGGGTAFLSISWIILKKMPRPTGNFGFTFKGLEIRCFHFCQTIILERQLLIRIDSWHVLFLILATNVQLLIPGCKQVSSAIGDDSVGSGFYRPCTYVRREVMFSTGVSVQLVAGGDTLSQVWGRGGTPSQVWVGGGTPSQVWGGTPSWGGTPCLGGTPSPPPPIAKSSIVSTCYAAGGVPLAFTQEDFLVFNFLNLFIYLFIFLSNRNLWFWFVIWTKSELLLTMWPVSRSSDRVSTSCGSEL